MRPFQGRPHAADTKDDGDRTVGALGERLCHAESHGPRLGQSGRQVLIDSYLGQAVGWDTATGWMNVVEREAARVYTASQQTGYQQQRGTAAEYECSAAASADCEAQRGHKQQFRRFFLE